MNRDLQPWLAATLGHVDFYRRYPDYVYVLAGLEAVDDPAVPAIAVSQTGGRLRLHINRGFFRAKSRFLPRVLLHEIHHVVLGHLTRLHLREVIFPDLIELAMEICANEYIEESRPGQPCRWRDDRDVGLAAHQSTRERYELLAEARRRSTLKTRRWRAVGQHGFLEGPANEDQGSSVVGRVLAEIPAETSGCPREARPRIAGRTPAEF